MIDINIIRQKPDWVKEQIAKLNDTAPIDEILAADRAPARNFAGSGNATSEIGMKAQNKSAVGWAA